MSIIHSAYRTVDSGIQTLSSSGDKLTFQPVEPVEVIRWGVLVTTALTVASLILTGDHEQIAGAALTPAGAGDLGTLTVTTTVGVLGAGAYTETVNPNAEFSEGGGERTAAGVETGIVTKPFLVFPGEQIAIGSDGGPTAGAGVVWIMYRPKAFVDATTKRVRAPLTAPFADDTWLGRYTLLTS